MMRTQEQTEYKCSTNYFSSAKSRRRKPVISTPQDRSTLMKWAYEILDACNIERSVAGIAISYFDRFMCTTSRRAKNALASKHEFQLVFISCLILAMKCRSGMSIDLEVVSKVICQELYNQEELNAMESEILRALNWKLNGPSVHEFIACFIEFLPSLSHSNEEVVHILMSYSEAQADIAATDYSLALELPSSIAFASLLSSMQTISHEMFHPLDRVALMQSILMIAGLHVDDENISLVRERLLHVVQDYVSSTPSDNNKSSFSKRSVALNNNTQCQLDINKARQGSGEIYYDQFQSKSKLSPVSICPEVSQCID